MKTVALLLSLVVLTTLVGCGTTKPWTRGDKIAAGYFLAGQVADFWTTERNHDDHATWKAHENNPILGDDPSDTELAIYFPISSLVTLGLAHYFPKWRKVILYGHGTANWYCAYNNNRIYHEWEGR